MSGSGLMMSSLEAVFCTLKARTTCWMKLYLLLVHLVHIAYVLLIWAKRQSLLCDLSDSSHLSVRPLHFGRKIKHPPCRSLTRMGRCLTPVEWTWEVTVYLCATTVKFSRDSRASTAYPSREEHWIRPFGRLNQISLSGWEKLLL